MNVMDFLFETSKLDILRPKYEAKLRISSSDNEFSGICQCKVKPGLPSIINMDMSLFSEENLIPGRVIDNVLLEVLDQFSNHVEEGTKLNVHVAGLCFLDKKSSVQKVNGEGFIDLCGALKVLGGFGSEACIAIYHHEKKIFSKIFQVVIRELKAVNVPETCPAGSFLEIIFEISDSDGLVDESIDGPLHTLNITSNELSLVEGAQYGIKHGRCVVSHVQLPHQQGKVTIVACHTHYPDLEITIQLQIQPFDLALTSFEDGTKSILSDPISSVDSSNLLIPCQLAPAEPSHLVTYVKDVVKKTKNKVGDTYSKMKSTEKILGTLSSSKDLLEEEIVTLKAEVGPIVGSFIDAKELIRNKIREKIGTAAFVLCSSGESFMEGVVGIVALLGTVPDRKIGRMLAVYLGKDGMLSVVCKTMDAANYIEKYNNHGDVDVGFGIHHKAAVLGVPIKSRFSIICLDDIEPYKGGLIRNSPQKELNLVGPFRHVKKPKGFKGFAVNMINLSDENLNITTSSGHGLRETLLYSLFGVLQVYETRNDMFQDMDYLNGGAISLDGGVIKGKGKILLGYSDPKITFPVVSPKTPNELKAHPDVIAKTRKLEDKVKLLEATKTKISQEEKVREELYEKFNKRKRKFEEISEIVTQPRGNELAIRRTPVKEEMLDP
nr:structural maintenance of chromosomes flexible hinge domain-containing protein GMI1 [Setaria viridis]